MLPDIYELLKAAGAPITSILGANPKVYAHGVAPQGMAAPYVVWSVINDAPENNLSDLPPMDRVTVQVDCYSPTDDGIRALAPAIRDALEPHGHMTGMPINQREIESPKLYRIALQFDLWVGR